MKVAAFAGFSGSGKTTLVEQLIPALRGRGLRVSVVKHAHHSFDIDHPGKDTWRHRQAGAFEVVAASDRRLVMMREFDRAQQLTVHQLLAELSPQVDWVLVEGFKDSDLPKIEVWRAPEPGQLAKPLRYPWDALVIAIATNATNATNSAGAGNAPRGLPTATKLPLLDLNAPAAIARWLIDNGARFEYQRPLHRELLPCTQP